MPSCILHCEHAVFNSNFWSQGAIAILREGLEAPRLRRIACLTLAMLGMAAPTRAQILDKRALFARQTWWDNRDFDWYAARIGERV